MTTTILNIQEPEKRTTTEKASLEVVDIFHTIQGEGPFSGARAIFIRLAGCNLQCPGCDTDYTTDRKEMDLLDISNDVANLGLPPHLVVITGGEPFRQNISMLVNTLIATGYTVQIETNGTVPPSKGLSRDAVIVCSPKTARINNVLGMRANCFKYVIHADSVDTDGLPIKALDNWANPRVGRPPKGASNMIYVQPMDCQDPVQNELNVQECVSSCITHGYLLQLQIHKLVGVA